MKNELTKNIDKSRTRTFLCLALSFLETLTLLFSLVVKKIERKKKKGKQSFEARGLCYLGSLKTERQTLMIIINYLKQFFFVYFNISK